MLEDIRSRITTEAPLDFVVATGDLAFSGKESEYELVAQFLGDLIVVTGLNSDRVFCVPGNHDVQRERSKMCFKGARSEVRNEGDVYRLLADDDERDQLLRRQAEYRAFEAAWAGDQDREYTQDGLGYVSRVEIDDLRIAIMGLNSAWLSEGGAGDDGKLLIGESQVKSAIDIARAYAPHVVLGLQHHPFDLLQRFDRRPVQRRLEDACNFVHCGHLHDPEVTEVVAATRRCITVAAGASFESRVFRNTFTTVELDPLGGTTEVAFVQYNPQVSAFEYVSSRTLEHRIDGACSCTVAELAEAIDSYCDEAADVSGYVASLLLGFSSDVPMMSKSGVVFGNWDSVEGVGEADFRDLAANFRGVGRAVRLLYGRKSLDEILAAHGEPIAAFVGRLEALSKQESVVKDYLKTRNEARTRPRALGDGEPLRHTVGLLEDLVRADDWDGARDLAERTIDVTEGASRVRVGRILALCLARSTEEGDNVRAASLYREAAASEQAEAGDWGALATLMTGLSRYDEAESVIRDGMERFPDQVQALKEVGMRLVQASGDRGFRDWLNAKSRGQ